MTPFYAAWFLSGIVFIPFLPLVHAVRWIVAPYGSPAQRNLARWTIVALAAWPICLGVYALLANQTDVLEWLWD